MTSALVCEELGWADLSIALHLLAPRLLAYPVIELGSAAQQQQVLPALAGDRYVAGTAARWWTTLSPKRRQELALAAAGTVVAGVAVLVTLGVRAAVRRARARAGLG